MVQFMLSNKFARIFVFAYAVILHGLVTIQKLPLFFGEGEGEEVKMVQCSALLVSALRVVQSFIPICQQVESTA